MKRDKSIKRKSEFKVVHYRAVRTEYVAFLLILRTKELRKKKIIKIDYIHNMQEK